MMIELMIERLFMFIIALPILIAIGGVYQIEREKVDFPTIGIEYRILPDKADISMEEVCEIRTSAVDDLFLFGSIIKDNGEVEIDRIVQPMIVEDYTIVKKEKSGNNFIVKVEFYNSNFEKENVTMYVDRDNIKHLAYKMKNDRERYEEQKSTASEYKRTLAERKSIVQHSIANM